jgi:two-component system, NtrC family, response regulator AtoC
METILIIDDDESFGETLELFFSEQNYNTIRAKNGKDGVAVFETEHPDIVLTDLRMPFMDGMGVLEKIKSSDSHIPVVMITGVDEIKTTIEAMQKGAYDYIEKTMELERIKSIVKRALESKKLSERLTTALSEDTSEYQIENSLIGSTPAIKEIIKNVGRLSSNKVNILIHGESGTGKELITKIIHFTGVTKDEPFIAVNCTALSESLLESELFGHVKGSFTGAVRDKKGKFELAGEGTIFLDEISEISSNLQVKLLRVLQEREFERVGGESTIPIKARIIAASNKNLTEMVSNGEFRADLYYRLNVFKIDIPPLRERKEDIPKLVVHFLKKINKELHKNVWKVPYDVMEMLQNYEWIGNVRELENTLMQAVVLAKGDVLERECILLRKNKLTEKENTKKLATMSLADVEKKHIKLVLDEVKWDKQAAAKILGIAKTTLYNKIEAYNLMEEPV